MLLDPPTVASILVLIHDHGKLEHARTVGQSLCAAQNVYQHYEPGELTRRLGPKQKSSKFVKSNNLSNFILISTSKSYEM